MKCVTCFLHQAIQCSDQHCTASCRKNPLVYVTAPCTPICVWTASCKKSLKYQIHFVLIIKGNDPLENDERFDIRTSHNNTSFSFYRSHRKDLKQQYLIHIWQLHHLKLERLSMCPILFWNKFNLFMYLPIGLVEKYAVFFGHRFKTKWIRAQLNIMTRHLCLFFNSYPAGVSNTLHNYFSVFKSRYVWFQQFWNSHTFFIFTSCK